MKILFCVLCAFLWLDKSVARNGHRVLPVVTTATLPVVLSGLRHDQRYFNRVTQTNQTIRQLRASVKRLDLIPEMAQLANRTRQSIATAYEPDVMPHDVLNRLHVTLDQSGIRLVSQTTLIPRRNVIKLRRRSVPFCERSLDLERRSISPHESFQKRSGRKPIRAVNTRATDLANRIKISNRRTRPLIHQHAAAKIVRRRNHRHRLVRDIETNLQTLFIDKRKTF